MTHVFEKSVHIPASADRVFAWHEMPGALQKLIPPGEPIRVLEHTGGISNGARVLLQMGYPPFTLQWLAVHEGYLAGRQFQDRQQRGPFRSWLHTHTFTPVDSNACVLRDHIDFELPFSPLADLALPFVRKKLEATFAYRHSVTLAAFE